MIDYPLRRVGENRNPDHHNNHEVRSGPGLSAPCKSERINNYHSGVTNLAHALTNIPQGENIHLIICGVH